jgi:hypothetical protein
MVLSHGLGRKTLWIETLLLASLVIGGCAGFKPYESRNNREKGPEMGLFTGSRGAFEILRKAEAPEKSSEDKKSINQAEGAAQPGAEGDQSGNPDEPRGVVP